MGAFVQRLQSARANIHRNIQPRFHGNDNVSVDEELSEDQLLQYLSHYSGNNHPGPQVRALMTILAGQDWSITAGFHRGGLGGAAGGADPRDHITLSTGHHLRFRDDRRTLIEITGHGIPLSEAREAAQSGPSQAEQDLDAWK